MCKIILFFIISNIFFFFLLSYVDSYYSYLRGFVNSNSDLFVASEQKPSDDMLYILQKPKSIFILFIDYKERNVTLISGNFFNVFYSNEKKIELPLQEVCSDHMNTFKIIVSTKINMYQREFRCKTSFFDEVWYCTQDPINNVCLKVASKIFVLLFLFLYICITYYILAFFFKIMDLFSRRKNLPNQNKVNEQDVKLEALLTENKEAFDFIFKKIQEIETSMHTNNNEFNRLNSRSGYNFDNGNEYTNNGDSSIKGENQINIQQSDYNNTYTNNGNSSAKGGNQINNQQFESYNQNYFKNMYNNFKNKLNIN
ncbi:G2-like (plasmid) [Dictyostelium discoideum]|uniref:G2-like n=1 Tax=Dictyostelium discoideum TaxID=44689 RepID=O60987_DICDI|nr:G2-like [Dictyostelium discoideum]AAC14394.1 G2-like [Dictyostelium discoideum]|eukprot:NP_046747.1 G2-like (plasmid) [Dictyostelium discoideum]